MGFEKIPDSPIGSDYDDEEEEEEVEEEEGEEGDEGDYGSDIDYDDPEQNEKHLEGILKDAGCVDLENETAAEQFIERHGSRLSARGRNGCTLIHKILAREDDYFEQNKSLLRLLLRNYPELLEKPEDDGRETALYMAVRNKPVDVVRFLCEAVPDAMKALRVSAKDDNCLHRAVRKNASTAEYLIGLVGKRNGGLIDKRNGDMLIAKDREQNTPLHIAVDYEHCKEAQIPIVERLLECCDAAMDVTNAEGMTPYRYHLRTRHKPNGGGGRADKASARNKETKSASKPSEKSFTTNKPGNKPVRQKGMKKPRAELKKEASKAEREESSDKIQQILKLRCMRYRNRDTTIKILYGQFPARAVEFDLNGPNVHYTDTCLKNMKYLQFEDILQYVALPKLSIEKDSAFEPPPRAKMGQPKPDGKGRKDLQVIFDWLWDDKKVTKIIRVIVEDNVEDEQAVAHSDEAIEKALSRFGVEVWDWRKVDISIDTIKTAAPDVREVHLYSSGNNAILLAWADTSGLVTLEKLEKVYLFVKQGLETRRRTQRNVGNFEAGLRARRSGIEVIVTIAEDSGNTHQARNIGTEKEQTTPNRWLECMDHFNDAIVQNYRLPSRAEPYEEIRVALIDDGIDAAHQKIQENIECGVSFCRRQGSSDLSNAFYVASGGHGTLMASLIRRLCTKVRLFVAKLDERIGENGGKQITAESAAKAVDWAIEQNVHIISMSWTVEHTGKNTKGINALKNAIARATGKDILLFCSANDMGIQKDKCYPASCDSKKIFRIGAATATGDKWKWVGDGQIDFIFPGEKINIEPEDSALMQSYKSASGSSLATAIAAGLAALILYMVGTLNHDNLEAMRDSERMREAFMAAQTTGGPAPYLLVWELFRTDIKKDDKAMDEGEIFRWVAEQLAPKGIS